MNREYVSTWVNTSVNPVDEPVDDESQEVGRILARSRIHTHNQHQPDSYQPQNQGQTIELSRSKSSGSGEHGGSKKPKVFEACAPRVGVGLSGLRSPANLRISVKNETKKGNEHEQKYVITPSQRPPGQKSPGPRHVAPIAQHPLQDMERNQNQNWDVDFDVGGTRISGNRHGNAMYSSLNEHEHVGYSSYWGESADRNGNVRVGIEASDRDRDGRIIGHGLAQNSSNAGTTIGASTNNGNNMAIATPASNPTAISASASARRVFDNRPDQDFLLDSLLNPFLSPQHDPEPEREREHDSKHEFEFENGLADFRGGNGVFPQHQKHQPPRNQRHNQYEHEHAHEYGYGNGPEDGYFRGGGSSVDMRRRVAGGTGVDVYSQQYQQPDLNPVHHRYQGGYPYQVQQQPLHSHPHPHVRQSWNEEREEQQQQQGQGRAYGYDSYDSYGYDHDYNSMRQGGTQRVSAAMDVNHYQHHDRRPGPIQQPQPQPQSTTYRYGQQQVQPPASMSRTQLREQPVSVSGSGLNPNFYTHHNTHSHSLPHVQVQAHNRPPQYGQPPPPPPPPSQQQRHHHQQQPSRYVHPHPRSQLYATQAPAPAHAHAHVDAEAYQQEQFQRLHQHQHQAQGQGQGQYHTRGHMGRQHSYGSTTHSTHSSVSGHSDTSLHSMRSAHSAHSMRSGHSVRSAHSASSVGSAGDPEVVLAERRMRNLNMNVNLNGAKIHSQRTGTGTGTGTGQSFEDDVNTNTRANTSTVPSSRAISTTTTTASSTSTVTATTPSVTTIPPLAQRRRAVDNESPVTKRMLKSFYKQLHDVEKHGFFVAREFALDLLPRVASKSHWRILLELADLARREDRDEEAGMWYRAVNAKQPLAASGWLEHANFLQDCGKIGFCGAVLAMGLSHCPENEALLTKSIRFLERYNTVDAARAVLARTLDIPISQNWKVILEGALMEARSGDENVAHMLFNVLLRHVWWYGPLYIEAAKFEERRERYDEALHLVIEGLRNVARYGPLWFLAFKLIERLKPSELDEIYAQSLTSISKELVWKVHVAKAQAATRAGNLTGLRQAYAEAVSHSPPNQLWRVWLPAARSELWLGSVENARRLLQRALSECPKRVRSGMLLEKVRLEEFCGNIDVARQLLDSIRHEMKQEWKVFLESLLLEMRYGNMRRAYTLAKEALVIHPGTGRLWAVYVQLSRIEDRSKQMAAFKKAVHDVPKSGEVWCEGARCHLDPTSPAFNLSAARRYLEFATQFTPQYGDSFVEMVRLVLLESGPQEYEALEQITAQCANADPNYGVAWFHCRRHPLESARQVVRNAIAIVRAELEKHKQVYQRAVIASGSASDPSSSISMGMGMSGMSGLSMNVEDPFTFSTAIEGAGLSGGTTREQKQMLIFGNSMVLGE